MTHSLYVTLGFSDLTRTARFYGAVLPPLDMARMADVDENVGWVILELEGEQAEIDRGLAWAQELGVRVDPLAGDVVEGG